MPSWVACFPTTYTRKNMIELLVASALSPEGLAVIGFGLAALSEILALNPKTKDNSITQGIAHMARRVAPKSKGDERAKLIIDELKALREDVEAVKREGFLHEDLENLGRGR